MKNGVIKLMKRLLAFVLIFILCIETFAAAVSDNDGSAFITKAEFDSLKNNFQTQIDQYNTSIDVKIDSAIAAYLSGVKVITTESFEVPITNYKNMMWVNDLLLRQNVRTWQAGATTTYTDSGWGWRRTIWNNVRNLRTNGMDLNSIWLSAGNMRQASWLLHITPNIENNVKFGGSDYYSNRIDNLAVPVFVLDLPLVNGYNVLKDGQNKLFSESMCEIYGNINPRWEEGYDYEDGSGRTTNIWEDISNFVTTRNTRASISSDDNYWLKIEARAINSNSAFKLSSDGVNYEPKEWNEVTDRDKWTIWQNFDSKAGTFAQPASWFIKEARNLRNTGFLSVIEWFDLGGNPMNITNNRGNNYQARLSMAYRDHYQRFETLLNDFMLGQNSTQICNVGNQKDVDEYSGSTWRYDWTKSEWANLDVDWDFTVVSQPNAIGAYKLPGVVIGDFQVRSEESSTIKWPLWPRLSVMDLRHSQYVLNNVPLKVGQGLPLIINVPNKGVLKMKFKYSVKHQQETGTPSQKAKIYVKKNDFTTNVSSDYYENQATATTTEGSLNGYVMETNNTLEFSIPVKKEDSVWMRLSPYSTEPDDLYATIDSIQMQIEAE